MTTTYANAWIYAAFSEHIYRRDRGDDQSIRFEDLNEIGRNVTFNELNADQVAAVNRFSSKENGEFYDQRLYIHENRYIYSESGFQATIAEVDDKWVITFRGSDTVGSPLDPRGDRNEGDWVTNAALGLGGYRGSSSTLTYLEQVLLVTQMVVEDPAFAGGVADDVVVTGQSLGAGLAGLAAYFAGVDAVLFAAAPFAKSMDDIVKLSDFDVAKAFVEANQGSFTEAFLDEQPIRQYMLLKNGFVVDDLSTGPTTNQYYTTLADPSQLVENFRALLSPNEGFTATIATYTIEGEFLTSEDSVIARGLDLGGAEHFSEDVNFIDIGPSAVDPTNYSAREDGARHSPALHAILVRTQGADDDFGQLLADTPFLKMAYLYDGELLYSFLPGDFGPDNPPEFARPLRGAAEGAVGAEIDAQGVPLPSDPSRLDTEGARSSGGVYRLLWKAYGDEGGDGRAFYDYFHDFFDIQLSEGIFEEYTGFFAIQQRDIYTGLGKIATMFVRDSVQETGTLAEFLDNAGDRLGLADGVSGSQRFQFAGNYEANGYLSFDMASLLASQTAADRLTLADGSEVAHGVWDLVLGTAVQVALTFRSADDLGVSDGEWGFGSTGQVNGIVEAVFGASLRDLFVAERVQNPLVRLVGGGEATAPAWNRILVDDDAGEFSLVEYDGGSHADASHLYIGGDGESVLTGSNAADTIMLLAGRDQAIESAGADTILGGQGVDTYEADPDAPGEAGDVFVGGSGWDVADYSAYSDDTSLSVSVIGFGHQGVASAEAGYAFTVVIEDAEDLHLGVEGIIASQADDEIDLSEISNARIGVRLDGQGGNDMLIGGASNDTIIGGAGDDTLRGGEGGDLFFFHRDHFASDGAEAAVDILYGGDADDRIIINGQAIYGGTYHAFSGSSEIADTPDPDVFAFGSVLRFFITDTDTNELTGQAVTYGTTNFGVDEDGNETFDLAINVYDIAAPNFVGSVVSDGLVGRIIIRGWEQGDYGLELPDLLPEFDYALFNGSGLDRSFADYVRTTGAAGGPDVHRQNEIDDYYDFYTDEHDDSDDSHLDVVEGDDSSEPAESDSSDPDTDTPNVVDGNDETFAAGTIDDGSGNENHGGAGLNGDGGELERRITDEGGREIVTSSLEAGGLRILGSFRSDIVVLQGSSDEDEIYGNEGDDLLDGVAGNDVLDGGDGDDTLFSGGGEDVLRGGSGNDYLFVVGDQRLNLEYTHSFRLDAIEGGNLIDGGDGDDVIVLSGQSDDTVDGGAGDDRIRWDGEVTWFGHQQYAGQDLIRGGTGNDTLSGSTGSDTLFGDEGDDVLFANQGQDILYGGEGNDLLQMASTNTANYISARFHGGAGNDTVRGGNDTNRVWAGTGDDLVIGGADRNYIYGDEGNDTLLGADDSDDIFGGDGDDIIVGGNGFNDLEGGAGNDSITGGSFRDNVDGGHGADTIEGGAYSDILSGGADVDADLVNGGAGDDTISVYANDVVRGGDGDDIFTSFSAGASIIDTGAGIDRVVLNGSDGDLTIVGFQTSEIIEIRSLTVREDGFEVWNRADLASAVLVSDLRADSVSFVLSTADGTYEFSIEGLEAEGIDIVTTFERRSFNPDEPNGPFATELNWQLIGTGSFVVNEPNRLGGTDVFGTASSDRLVGGSGNDAIHGLTGADRLFGSDGDDSLSGDLGDDYLDGGDGLDLLSGGAGADTLRGSVSDTLLGGYGDDRLVFVLGEPPLPDDGGLLTDMSSDFDLGLIGGPSGLLDGGEGDDRLIIEGAGRGILRGGQGDDTLDARRLTSTFEMVDDTLGGGDTLEGPTSPLPFASLGIDRENLFVDQDVTQTVDLLVLGGPGGVGPSTQAPEISLLGGDGDDLFLSVGSNLLLDGGAGFDTVSYVNAETGITADLSGGAVSADVIRNVEVIIGSAHGDLLVAGDTLITLIGGGGSDTLVGGIGSDLLNGGRGADQLIGGDGDDTAHYGRASEAITIDLLAGLHTGEAFGDTFSSIERIVATRFDDVLSGSLGRDRFFGGEGDDILIGHDGNDVLEGGMGSDVHDGGQGIDTVQFINAREGLLLDFGMGAFTGEAAGDTFVSIERFVASAHNDTLLGGDEGEILIGGAGDDTLDGGSGNDRLQGDAGSDLFVFGFGSGRDVVADFEAGTDVLDLSGFGFGDVEELSTVSDQRGSHLHLDFGDGDRLILLNTTFADIQGADIYL